MNALNKTETGLGIVACGGNNHSIRATTSRDTAKKRTQVEVKAEKKIKAVQIYAEINKVKIINRLTTKLTGTS